MRIFTFSILFLISNSVFSQQLNKDSLLRELNKANEDTSKVILYRILTGTLRLAEPSKAIEYGKAGVVLGKKLNFDKGTAGCYLNLSACYSNLGIIDSALNYIDTAIYYSHRAGDPNRLALAYLNRADFYMQLQDFNQSLKNCDTSLKYAEQVNSDDRRARVFQTIGSVYFFQQQYKQSAEYYNKAYILYKKINNLQMSAIALNNLALIYKNTGEYKNAADNLLQAISIASSLKDLSNMSMYYGTLSDVYFNNGNYTRAEKYADTCMHYARQLKNEKQVGNAWEYLGQVYLKQKRNNDALNALNNGFVIFNQQGDNDKINTTAEILAEAYSSIGNYQKAYDFLMISKKANDTLVKQRYDANIAAMQTRFKVDEKDKEIQLLDKSSQLQEQKISQQRILIFTSIAIAILALTGIGMAISRYNLRHRMKELELRNRIAADLHDEVGSSLSSIHMLSQLANQKNNGDSSQAEILNRMSTNAKETMEKMGDIVWMIKPGETEATNLKQRIERFAHEICNSREIETEMNLEELERTKLSMEQRKNIYLIFKEALNNAVKYSGANKIEVKVTTEGKQLKMIIKDNGKGFEASNNGQGNGLANMNNRAKDLEGTLLFDSENSRGTSITLLMPV